MFNKETATISHTLTCKHAACPWKREEGDGEGLYLHVFHLTTGE